MQVQDIGLRIEYLRKSASIYPFNYKFRSASALELGDIALQTQLKYWREIAITELKNALWFDPYSPELLLQATLVEFSLNNYENADKYHDRFKLVAKHSTHLNLLSHLHKD